MYLYVHGNMLTGFKTIKKLENVLDKKRGFRNTTVLIQKLNLNLKPGYSVYIII